MPVACWGLQVRCYAVLRFAPMRLMTLPSLLLLKEEGRYNIGICSDNAEKWRGAAGVNQDYRALCGYR
jgi:hypothetical protein